MMVWVVSYKSSCSVEADQVNHFEDSLQYHARASKRSFGATSNASSFAEYTCLRKVPRSSRYVLLLQWRSQHAAVLYIDIVRTILGLIVYAMDLGSFAVSSRSSIEGLLRHRQVTQCRGSELLQWSTECMLCNDSYSDTFHLKNNLLCLQSFSF